MAKQNKPAIRFKGFTDAWEQRKLGEIATFINGRAYSQPELLSSGKYKVLRVGNFYTNDSWYYSDLELGEKYYADYGDLLYTWSATFGPHIWLGDRVIYHYHIWKINLSDQLEKQFAVQLLEQDRTNILSSKNGSTMVHITKEGMEQKDVIIPPSTKEQQEIGAFFLQLDNLITLHQRKYDKLQVLKKAMLEKMFPKNGSSVPEIRFKGFTDAWEQRKLSEIAGKVTEKNTGLQYVETLTNSAEFGIISQRDFFDHDISKLGSLDGYYIVRNEDFVYNPRISTSAPVGPINRNKLGRTGVMSPLYTVFRPHDIDTTYLEHFFKCGYWYSFMNFNGDSGARSDRFSIKDDVFFQMPIPVPHIEEQRKIGLFLTQLDHLITLHQRELEKLQNIKKSMLEKMFV